MTESNSMPLPLIDILVIYDELYLYVYGTLCEKVASSIVPGVRNILHYHHRNNKRLPQVHGQKVFQSSYMLFLR